MICSNCGMIIGSNDIKCSYCSGHGTETINYKNESRDTMDNNSKESVEREVSPVEKYGLLGQKRVLVTSRGARLGLFNTKILTEITYGSDGLMIQKRPKRLQGASKLAYEDIMGVTTKRTISTYWIILMVLGVVIAAFTSGLGLLLSVVAFFCGRDHTVCIQQKNGSTLNITSASGTNANLFYAELQKIIEM